MQDLSVAGHLADSDSSSPDLSTLKTFSYVILGLLGAVLVLMLVLISMVAKVMKKEKTGKGYKALHDPASAPHESYEHKPYAGYSTPYADGGH